MTCGLRGVSKPMILDCAMLIKRSCYVHFHPCVWEATNHLPHNGTKRLLTPNSLLKLAHESHRGAARLGLLISRQQMLEAFSPSLPAGRTPNRRSSAARPTQANTPSRSPAPRVTPCPGAAAVPHPGSILQASLLQASLLQAAGARAAFHRLQLLIRDSNKSGSSGVVSMDSPRGNHA